MTESAPSPKVASGRPAPRPRRRRLRPGPVFAAGAVTFALTLGLLGWQVAVGQDPSLGHGKQKPKIVNRTIHRTVVEKVYDPPKVVYVDPGPGYSSGGYSGGGYSGGGSSGGSSSGGGSVSPAPAPTYTPPPVSSGAS